MQCKTENLASIFTLSNIWVKQNKIKNHYERKQQWIKSFSEGIVFTASSGKKTIQTINTRADYEKLINRFQKSYWDFEPIKTHNYLWLALIHIEKKPKITALSISSSKEICSRKLPKSLKNARYLNLLCMIGLVFAYHHQQHQCGWNGIEFCQIKSQK